MALHYLNDAAPARCRLHRLQQDGISVLAAAAAAAGEDDTAARSLWNIVGRFVAAQPISTSITLRHVDEDTEELI